MFGRNNILWRQDDINSLSNNILGKLIGIGAGFCYDYGIVKLRYLTGRLIRGILGGYDLWIEQSKRSRCNTYYLLKV